MMLCLHVHLNLSKHMLCLHVGLYLINIFILVTSIHYLIIYHNYMISAINLLLCTTYTSCDSVAANIIMQRRISADACNTVQHMFSSGTSFRGGQGGAIAPPLHFELLS